MKRVTLPGMADVLPEWLKSRLITFSVESALEDSTTGNVTIVTVPNNKLALRSKYELDGINSGAYIEGIPVRYYSTVPAHRIKNNRSWWTRTLMGAVSAVYVSADGSVQYSEPVDNSDGVAPFGCL
jgi:hypothetical protein